MPYVRDVPPVGATRQELVRFYDTEYQKIEAQFTVLDAVLEALDVIGIAQAWFWSDVVLGDPGPGFMRADSNVMSTITQINVNFENVAGKSAAQLLKTSTIDEGTTVGIINTSGLGSGIYLVDAPTIINATFLEISVSNFQGQSGNPQPDDIMQLRWDFNSFAPQRVLP